MRSCWFRGLPNQKADGLERRIAIARRRRARGFSMRASPKRLEHRRVAAYLMCIKAASLISEMINKVRQTGHGDKLGGRLIVE